ncbi:hypothetical protein AAIH70_21015 [Neorhizobium sp. BT27B]|uniref:hypothetical protein n=1 Tax=Neorhizobium sp. BT27B TaxID=3142625 RepID=UPI003D2849C1
MNQDDLASLSITEIAQQLAALAAALRELAKTPIFDKPANDDEAEVVNSIDFSAVAAGAHRRHAVSDH